MITCACDSYQLGSAGTHSGESMTQSGPAQLAACQIQQSSGVLVAIRKVSSLIVLKKGGKEGGRSMVVVPVIRCDLAMVTVIFSFSCLSIFFITSLQLLSFALLSHSHPTLSRPLLMQSSHRILYLPCLIFTLHFLGI